jgi:hypothetical protein
MPSPFNTDDSPINSAVKPSTASDYTIPGRGRWVRADAAGTITIRYPNDGADCAFTVVAAEYIPVCNGAIVRASGAAYQVLSA